ncbi:unnamed protein product, partial [Musa textilis]
SRKRGDKEIHGFQGFSQGKRKGREGLQGVGGAVGGQVRQGVEHLGDEEGQGDHPLRIHPPYHYHRHELRAQTPTLPAPQPRLMFPSNIGKFTLPDRGFWFLGLHI